MHAPPSSLPSASCSWRLEGCPSLHTGKGAAIRTRRRSFGPFSPIDSLVVNNPSPPVDDSVRGTAALRAPGGGFLQRHLAVEPNLCSGRAEADNLAGPRTSPAPTDAQGISRDTGVTMPGTDAVSQNDLLIVGPGVLGRLVAEKWLKEHPGCKVFGQTASTDHHSELTDIGIIPSLKGSTISQKAPYVIFCAPPSRSDDYPGDLRLAASNWSGEGSFLFTSSTALYDCSDNRSCSEDCPSIPAGRGPRTDVLLRAENVVLDAGGCVLRLAGLYIS